MAAISSRTANTSVRVSGDDSDLANQMERLE
jgi:hypothetical protein